MRELSYAPTQIMHPSHVNGRTLWIDPAVQEIIDQIQNGDPTIGWEGDPRLAVYRGPENRWEVWRLEADGEYRLVARSMPGGALDRSIIFHLRAHDLRRQSAAELLAAVDKHNDHLRASRNASAHERAVEGLQKAMFYLDKEVGHHY